MSKLTQSVVACVIFLSISQGAWAQTATCMTETSAGQPVSCMHAIGQRESPQGGTSSVDLFYVPAAGENADIFEGPLTIDVTGGNGYSFSETSPLRPGESFPASSAFNFRENDGTSSLLADKPLSDTARWGGSTVFFDPSPSSPVSDATDVLEPGEFGSGLLLLRSGFLQPQPDLIAEIGFASDAEVTFPLDGVVGGVVGDVSDYVVVLIENLQPPVPFQPVPEPGSLALFLVGLGGFVLTRCKRLTSAIIRR